MKEPCNMRIPLAVALVTLLGLSSLKAVISIDFFEHLMDSPTDLHKTREEEEHHHPQPVSEKDKLFAIFRSPTTL